MAGVVILLIAGLLSAADVQAGWFTRSAPEAGVAAGGATGKAGARKDAYGSALAQAAASLKKIDPRDKTPALAAQATQEGHWRFANKSGEVFTAGTPEELKRGFAILLGGPIGARAADKVALYLTRETVFKHQDQLRKLLGDLPGRHSLYVVVGQRSFRIQEHRRSGAAKYYMKFGPRLLVEVAAPESFDELVWQLARPFERTAIRVLAFKPGGKKYVPSTRAAPELPDTIVIDHVDPFAWLNSVMTIRGQTALISGRVERGYLHFKPAGGDEGAILLTKLHAAAERADVNLIVLHADQSRQLDARNWLWQKATIDGLVELTGRATVADLLNALGGSRTAIELRLSTAGGGRVELTTGPMPDSAGSMVGMSDFFSQLSGNILSQGMSASLRSSRRQHELDQRILPGIPSFAQYIYIVALLAGLLALPVVRSWWRRLWPVEARKGYDSPLGYVSAQAVRGGVFALIFLPVVAVVALPVAVVGKVWSYVSGRTSSGGGQDFAPDGQS